MRLLVLTLLTLCLFAANSVLCRLALSIDAPGNVHVSPLDAGSFAVLRLLSGVVFLVVLYAFVPLFRRADNVQKRPFLISFTSLQPWLAGALLYSYAAFFSYAYVQLNTGVGALVLFGCVQLVMGIFAWCRGGAIHPLEYVGSLLAFLGLLYLIYPLWQSPSGLGLVCMAISGAAWAGYSLLGGRSNAPLRDTCVNFVATLPWLAVTLLFLWLSDALIWQWQGALYAIVSGCFASALGYVLWYQLLPSFSQIQAAVVQLAVPVLAALGGYVFVDDALSWRLSVAGVVIFIGVVVSFVARLGGLGYRR